jgi:ribosomal protein S18 acetylase RimI-like enzyme
MRIRIEKLSRDQNLDGFACRQPVPNEWLIRHALQAQRSDTSVTYVATLDGSDEIVGYVSLANGAILPDDRAERLRKGAAGGLPIPTVVLARLAVATAFEGRGIGGALLLHAMRAMLDVAGRTGVRALVVNPLDEAAAGFYTKYDLETISSIEPSLMYLSTKDIRKLVAHYDTVCAADRAPSNRLQRSPSR